jgi:hypothetical protein
MMFTMSSETVEEATDEVVDEILHRLGGSPDQVAEREKRRIEDEKRQAAFRKMYGLNADKDSAVLHEILDALHRRNLTVSEAHDILHKAERAIGLIPFQWNAERTLLTRELRR